MSDPKLTLFESLLSGAISTALRHGDDVGEMNHPGLRGLFREAFIEDVITPLLATPYKASTGVIVDFQGSQSNQADIVVWDDSIFPPCTRRVVPGCSRSSPWSPPSRSSPP
jgi:hypothetical protein